MGLKVDQKYFGWPWRSKMGVTSLVTRPHVVKNDHGLLVHETINSAASFYEFMNDFMN